MINNQEIKNILDKYTKIFKDEYLSTISQQLDKEESIVSRSNSHGHITASSIIVDGDKILLIFHNKLQIFIQPGGHIENDSSLWEAAQREMLEETGIKGDLHDWHKNNSYCPINIDIHTIPFNVKKQEPEHFHYDFSFIFRPLEKGITLQTTEVSNYKWISVNDSFGTKNLNNITDKIKKLNLSK